MRARLQQIGGALEIHSSSATECRGTTLCAVIPHALPRKRARLPERRHNHLGPSQNPMHNSIKIDQPLEISEMQRIHGSFGDERQRCKYVDARCGAALELCSIMKRILIADDHETVRSGLRALLEGRAGWEVVAEAHDGKEAVAGAIEKRPDVAIVDYSMPFMTGVEVTRRIREQTAGNGNTHFHDA